MFAGDQISPLCAPRSPFFLPGGLSPTDCISFLFPARNFADATRSSTQMEVRSRSRPHDSCWGPSRAAVFRPRIFFCSWWLLMLDAHVKRPVNLCRSFIHALTCYGPRRFGPSLVFFPCLYHREFFLKTRPFDRAPLTHILASCLFCFSPLVDPQRHVFCSRASYPPLDPPGGIAVFPHPQDFGISPRRGYNGQLSANQLVPLTPQQSFVFMC